MGKAWSHRASPFGQSRCRIFLRAIHNVVRSTGRSGLDADGSRSYRPCGASGVKQAYSATTQRNTRISAGRLKSLKQDDDVRVYPGRAVAGGALLPGASQQRPRGPHPTAPTTQSVVKGRERWGGGTWADGAVHDRIHAVQRGLPGLNSGYLWASATPRPPCSGVENTKCAHRSYITPDVSGGMQLRTLVLCLARCVRARGESAARRRRRSRATWLPPRREISLSRRSGGRRVSTRSRGVIWTESGRMGQEDCAGRGRGGRKGRRAGGLGRGRGWEDGDLGESVRRNAQKAQALLIETRFVSLPRRNVAQTLWGPLPVAIARSNFSCLGATPALQKARRDIMFFSSTPSL